MKEFKKGKLNIGGSLIKKLKIVNKLLQLHFLKLELRRKGANMAEQSTKRPKP